jgi:hypothetical protein
MVEFEDSSRRSTFHDAATRHDILVAMDSDGVSITIKAGKQAGDPSDLYDAAWDLIAATIKKNTKHASAK